VVLRLIGHCGRGTVFHDPYAFETND
jgi:hypothetical protein